MPDQAEYLPAAYPSQAGPYMEPAGGGSYQPVLCEVEYFALEVFDLFAKIGVLLLEAVNLSLLGFIAFVPLHHATFQAPPWRITGTPFAPPPVTVVPVSVGHVCVTSVTHARVPLGDAGRLATVVV